MKKRIYFFVFLLFFLVLSIRFSRADSQSLKIQFIIPDTSPYFTNLRNFTHYVGTPFAKTITAYSPIGIECYYLNDTSIFTVDCSGLITNITELNKTMKVELTITANNSLGEEVSGEFYINVIEKKSGLILCRFRKFGFYNTKYINNEIGFYNDELSYKLLQERKCQ